MENRQIRNDHEDTATNSRPMRFDRGTIKGKTSRTAEGYLRADAVVTRCGVFNYKNPDGSVRRELRHPDDVFNQVSLDSMKMIPMTNEHPEVKLLDASTAKKFQVGFTGENVRRDENDVMTSITATDSATIKDVDNGKKELSCGYTLDLVREDGIYEGQKYDFRQTNILYNHVAFTGRGRAGTARLNLDAQDAVELSDDEIKSDNENNNNNNSQRRNCMVKFRIDKDEFDADPQVVLYATRLENSLKETKTNLDSATTENSALKAERDTLKARLDTAEKRDVAKEISDAVKSRRSLENQASTFLGKDVNLDTMDDSVIRKAVVEKAFPTLKEKLVNCDSAYLNVSFDNAVAFLTNDKSGGASSQRQAVMGNGTRTDSETVDVEKSKAAYEKRMTEGWKNPTAK